MDDAESLEALELTARASQALAEGRWADAVEAARRSNVILFQRREPQSSPRVAENYLLAARGMFARREWHEAQILAELSLKGLGDAGADPGRADALRLIAEARAKRGTPATG